MSTLDYEDLCTSFLELGCALSHGYTHNLNGRGKQSGVKWYRPNTGIGKERGTLKSQNKKEDQQEDSIYI